MKGSPSREKMNMYKFISKTSKMVRTTLKELIIQCTSNMGDKSSTITRTTAITQSQASWGRLINPH